MSTTLVQSILSMYLDVYNQTDSQDINTGAIKKDWNFIKTVSCHAKGNISDTNTRGGSSQQTISKKYVNTENLSIRTIDKLTLRDKVTNIRDKSNNPIWVEPNYPSNTPTVFEVVGSTPILDPFGSLIGYNTSVKRSESQTIGI